MIEPIETIYNNLRFRSRLEAKWAVFYDHLGIKYEYEPEGYKLGNIWYLPDFWIINLKIFIEIKGILDNEAIIKASKLSSKYDCKVYIFKSIPNPDDQYPDFINSGAIAFFPNGDSDCDYHWCECLECGNLGISFSGRAERIIHKTGCPKAKSNKYYGYQTINLNNAYREARMARFEHGAVNV